MSGVNQILPELVSGRGTSRRLVEGPRRRRGISGEVHLPLTRQPLHHSLREWSPSPSKLGEELSI